MYDRMSCVRHVNEVAATVNMIAILPLANLTVKLCVHLFFSSFSFVCVCASWHVGGQAHDFCGKIKSGRVQVVVVAQQQQQLDRMESLRRAR